MTDGDRTSPSSEIDLSRDTFRRYRNLGPEEREDWKERLLRQSDPILRRIAGFLGARFGRSDLRENLFLTGQALLDGKHLDEYDPDASQCEFEPFLWKYLCWDVKKAVIDEHSREPEVIRRRHGLGTGDGVEVLFTGTLTWFPLKAGALVVSDGVQTVSDDGHGILSGDGVGSIDYETGAYAVSFATAVANGSVVSAAYRQNLKGASLCPGPDPPTTSSEFEGNELCEELDACLRHMGDGLGVSPEEVPWALVEWRERRLPAATMHGFRRWFADAPASEGPPPRGARLSSIDVLPISWFCGSQSDRAALQFLASELQRTCETEPETAECSILSVRDGAASASGRYLVRRTAASLSD